MLNVKRQYLLNVFEGMELGEPKLQYLMAASVVSSAVPIAVLFAFQCYFAGRGDERDQGIAGEEPRKTRNTRKRREDGA